MNAEGNGDGLASRRVVRWNRDPVEDEKARIFKAALEETIEQLRREAAARGNAPAGEGGLGEAAVQKLYDSGLRQQATVLAQRPVRDAEDAYRNARAEASLPWEGRPLLGLLRWFIVIAVPVVVVAASVMYGYAQALEAPPGELRDPSVISGAVLGPAFVALVVFVLAGLAIFFIGRWVARPRRQVPLVVAAFAVTTFATLLLGIQTRGVVVDGSDPTSAFWWTMVAFLVPAFTCVLFFSAPVREWWLAYVFTDVADERRVRETTKKEAWRAAIVETLLQLLRRAHPATDTDRFKATLTIGEAPGLRRVRDTAFHVRTDAERLLVRVSSGMDGGSIAISGPRGVGKTELLEAFCAGDDVAQGAPVGLSVVIRAPIVHDRREFMLHLFTELCERVRTLGPGLLRTKHLQQIRYLQTVNSETSLNATMRMLGLSRTRGTSLTREPLIYPDIVKALKDCLTAVADHLAGLGAGGGRLVIGIDELDRIQPAASAREFLNEVKVIFDVPNCLFVLSVSDEALREAELAPVGRRDVFDSAIDEVIRVTPLNQKDAAELLGHRVLGGLPEAFTALFNCLAGGIPRDLLRIARAATLFSTKQEAAAELHRIAARLVERQLDRIANSFDTDVPAEILQPLQGHIVTGDSLRESGEGILQKLVDSPEWEATGSTVANHFFFMGTVLDVFSADLTQEHIREAADPRESGRSFTALAKAGSSIGVNDHQVRSSLETIRKAWHLAPIKVP